MLVDDVITAGTAIRESMEIIQANGATLAGVLISLDRQERGRSEISAIQEVERDYNCKVISIITLKDLIAYVENPEKTRTDNPNLQSLWDIFSYVSRPEATEQGEYVSAGNCLKEIALQQMILTKKQYGKENGYIAWHGY